MDTIPDLNCAIILEFEGVASSAKWHSGFLKFLRRLRDCISCDGSGMDQEEEFSLLFARLLLARLLTYINCLKQTL